MIFRSRGHLSEEFLLLEALLAHFQFLPARLHGAGYPAHHPLPGSGGFNTDLSDTLVAQRDATFMACHLCFSLPTYATHFLCHGSPQSRLIPRASLFQERAISMAAVRPS